MIKFYNENTDTKSRNISDIALAHRADEIARNPMYDDTCVSSYIGFLAISRQDAILFQE